MNLRINEENRNNFIQTSHQKTRKKITESNKIGTRKKFMDHMSIKSPMPKTKKPFANLNLNNKKHQKKLLPAYSLDRHKSSHNKRIIKTSHLKKRHVFKNIPKSTTSTKKKISFSKIQLKIKKKKCKLKNKKSLR